MASAFGEPPRRHPVDRVRMVLYPALLLLAIAVVALRVTHPHASQAAQDTSNVNLRGLTEEQQPVAVTLSRGGEIRSLHVHLIGICENGGEYRIGWEPESPRIPFRSGTSGIVAHESAEKRSSSGIVSDTLAGTSAHVEAGDQGVSGDVRFQTTFRYPGGRILRCDSGFIHWAANRSGTANGEPRGGPGSYPLVSSLAVGATPGQLRFAALVDETCAASWNRDLLLERRRRRMHEPAKEQQAALVLDHAREYLSIGRLGRPSTRTGLYQRWLANMLERIRLESAAVAQSGKGKTRSAEVTFSKVEYLKVVGDALGQEFGLRVCTSNGPLRRRAGS